MVSRESRSLSKLQKSFSCYARRAKMAASGVQRGNRRRKTHLQDEDHDEEQKKRARRTRRDRFKKKIFGRGVQVKKKNTWSLNVSGGLGRRTGGEEGRDGGKKGKERSRAHPLSATPPSHNPLLLA